MLTLVSALPATQGTGSYCDSSGCTYYARDFSAYYEGAFRLIHNPSHVYAFGNVTGDYPIPPNSKHYRYSPFFLLLIVPLLALSYHDALVAFDLVQFALLPLLAYVVYRIFVSIPTGGGRTVRRTWLGLLLLALFVVLLQPFVLPPSGFTYWSWSYWWQWAEGQARVLQTLFIALAVLFVQTKPRASGLFLTLSSFDPRMTLAALPLVVYLGWKGRSLGRFGIGLLVSSAVVYTPTLLYSGLAGQFYASILGHNPYTFFAYEWIPFLAIAFLTFAILSLDILAGGFPRRRQAVTA